ncbi:MAG: hypothetical protein FWG88_08390 [Oscillospiraceae bacterium]|nr:hypothetical protein [Oscillospiraceae bacterium]
MRCWCCCGCSRRVRDAAPYRTDTGVAVEAGAGVVVEAGVGVTVDACGASGMPRPTKTLPY